MIAKPIKLLLAMAAVCSFAFLILNPSRVLAQYNDVGVGAATSVSTEKVYSKNLNSTQQKIKEQLKADIEGEKGRPSLQNLTKETGDSLQTYALLKIGGPGLAGEGVLGSMTPEDRQLAYEIYGDGLIGEMHNYLAFLYTKPASTATYVADVFQSAKIVPQAQAQGLGFASLDPILSTWKVFRNIAYFFFVLIFLAIGFMIMFRHKIDGQTVVTAQQAIPSIIVALLFVTFSYAIGGLLIDLMYLLMYLIIGLFQGSQDLINLNIFGLGAELIEQGFTSGFGATNSAITSIIESAEVGAVLGTIGGLSVAVIVAVAVLISLFKLFFELIKSYISIIINVAFAPVILMVGALPGKNTFKDWLSNIVGNLAPFPVLLILLIMQRVIKNSALNGASGGFMPPFLLGQGVSSAVPAIVSVGILIVTPEIIKKVKEQMGAKEGVFGELTSPALARSKEAMPLSSRLLALGYGGAAGGAVGGLRGLASGIRQGQPLYNMWTGMKEGAGATIRGRTIKIGNREIRIPGTATAAAAASRSMGANQPDIFNLLTKPIDKAFSPEEAEKEAAAQRLEDVLQRTGVSARDRS